MAELFISYINPIRFRPVGDNDNMPRIDKMQGGVQYYKGVYPLPNYRPNWLLGQQIVIQIQTDAPLLASDFDQIELYVVSSAGASLITNVTNVTPAGWQVNGSNGLVINYAYTPPSLGDYYFYTSNPFPTIDNYESEVFRVVNNDMNLVEIQYYDSKNSFDGVFYDNDTLIWSPKVYFTGIAIAGKPKSESDIYTDDPNMPTRTRGATQRTIDLKLTDITRNHYSQLIDIFTCDTNFVNGQKAINIDEPDTEEKEKSDAVDMLLNMIRVEDNNFVKNT